MPYATYKPGLQMPDLTDDQVDAISQIVAKWSSYGDGELSDIDWRTGVYASVVPTGQNRRLSAEIQASMFDATERTDNGDDRANGVADEAAEVLGYRVTVWLQIGGAFFFGDSERDSDES